MYVTCPLPNNIHMNYHAAGRTSHSWASRKPSAAGYIRQQNRKHNVDKCPISKNYNTCATATEKVARAAEAAELQTAAIKAAQAGCRE